MPAGKDLKTAVRAEPAAPGRSPITVSESFSLAVDAMGGDQAPGMVVEGLGIAAQRHHGARFLVVGDEARLAPLLAKNPRTQAVCMCATRPR